MAIILLTSFKGLSSVSPAVCAGLITSEILRTKMIEMHGSNENLSLEWVLLTNSTLA